MEQWTGYKLKVQCESCESYMGLGSSGKEEGKFRFLGHAKLNLERKKYSWEIPLSVAGLDLQMLLAVYNSLDLQSINHVY